MTTGKRSAAIILTLLLLALPLGGEAQPARVGLLGTLNATQYAAFVDALARGLRESGYVVGQHVVLEPRYAEGRLDRLPVLARELVERKPAVIVVWGDVAIRAAKEATARIPLVILSCDVLAAGLVDSLVRPTGNVTGVSCMSAELASKRLEILGEIQPRLSRVGYLWNPDDPSKSVEWSETQRAAEALGLRLHAEAVRDGAAIRDAFSRLKQVDALIVAIDPLTFTHRSMIAQLAAANRLPAMYAAREFVAAGGLMSYGPSKEEMFRAAGRYAGRILAGAGPPDLPIQQPTRFDLFVNVTAAKLLDLTIPRILLLQADDLIE